MALLYAEKFAKYNDDQHIIDDNPQSGITAGGGTGRVMVSAAGRFGDTVLSMTGRTTSLQFPFAAVSSSTVLYIAMTVLDNQLDTQSQFENILGAVDASGHLHFRLDTLPGGGLAIYRANTISPEFVATVGSVLGQGVWHLIEVKADMQNAGNVQVRVDGVEVMNVNADFRDAASDPLTGIRIYGSNATRYFDEIIIADDSGSTFNTWIGDFRIKQTVPDADGSVVDWTASTGTDVSCVDDAIAAYNGDTDYISSSTTDQESLFSHAAFTLTDLNDVKFVQVAAMARSDGSNTFRQLVRSGGTTYASGSDITPTSSSAGVYDWYNYRLELDPNGSIDWNETSINAAEFGVRARP